MHDSSRVATAGPSGLEAALKAAAVVLLLPTQFFIGALSINVVVDVMKYSLPAILRGEFLVGFFCPYEYTA